MGKQYTLNLNITADSDGEIVLMAGLKGLLARLERSAAQVALTKKMAVVEKMPTVKRKPGYRLSEEDRLMGRLVYEQNRERHARTVMQGIAVLTPYFRGLHDRDPELKEIGPLLIKRGIRPILGGKTWALCSLKAVIAYAHQLLERDAQRV